MSDSGISDYNTRPEIGPEPFRIRARKSLTSVNCHEFSGPHQAQQEEHWRGDHDLNPGLVRMPFHNTVRPAAVLVPVVARGDGLTVLLTKRPETMRTHAGQISFPGGKMESGDKTPIDTALRETEEEIGLLRRHIDVLGYLDNYQTGTGFLISPVVGLVSPGFDLQLDPAEVEEAFEVPLAFLMDEINHHRHSIEWGGGQRHYYAMPYGDRYIWGATAGILKNFYERVFTE